MDEKIHEPKNPKVLKKLFSQHNKMNNDQWTGIHDLNIYNESKKGQAKRK
jgi:hypothetical protein